MASDVGAAVRSAAERVTRYVSDVSILTVVTEYVQIGAGIEVNFDQAKPAARTIIKLDGDCATVVPMREASGGQLELDTALFELHLRNVSTAIEYRARILNALLGAVQSRLR